MNKAISKLAPYILLSKEYFAENKMARNFAIVGLVVVSFYGFLLIIDKFSGDRVIVVDKKTDYENTRLIDNSYSKIYHGKEKLLESKMNKILDGQRELSDSIKKINDRTNELEKKFEKPEEATTQSEGNEADLRQASVDTNSEIQLPPPSTEDQNLRIHESSFNYRSSAPSNGSLNSNNIRSAKNNQTRRRERSLISFPVKSTRVVRTEDVVLPSGSYVKAKLMTGIEAPEGKTYPVLLQLDFAHIIPNDKRLDLVGCFMIAKASGSLSTERVEMQAVKLSCVSKSGQMFERKINGFTADGGDNSFGVIGSVNTKQDRVAAMAFLSSVVEGVGKAIQMAQTTQSSNAVGGGQSIVTGDQAKYIGAGGISNAAGQVTQWYLKQAQSLLPTINVGSGQDVWIVMADKVSLPKEYFKQSRRARNDSVYSYFTNILY